MVFHSRSLPRKVCAAWRDVEAAVDDVKVLFLCARVHDDDKDL